MTEVSFKARYVGGEADKHRLNLYDASNSLIGISRALNITAHALINKGEVKKKGDKTKHVSIYLHPSKKGSFVEMVSILFEPEVYEAVGVSVLGAAFWDMLSYSWSQTTGQEYEPETSTVKKIIKNKEGFGEEISEALENPLGKIHRPITSDEQVKIEFHRARKGAVLEFNKETLDSVTCIKESPETDVVGNVTKFNVLTGYGRFYSDDNEKTIPFNLEESVSQESREILGKSLHWSVKNYDKKITIKARIILNNLGRVRRYLITDVYGLES